MIRSNKRTDIINTCLEATCSGRLRPSLQTSYQRKIDHSSLFGCSACFSGEALLGSCCIVASRSCHAASVPSWKRGVATGESGAGGDCLNMPLPVYLRQMERRQSRSLWFNKSFQKPYYSLMMISKKKIFTQYVSSYSERFTPCLADSFFKSLLT